MNTNWVELVSLYRGEISGQEVVEATHLGAFAVVSGDGELLYSLGDVSLPTHLRSTAKPFQLLPFVLRNLQTEMSLTQAEVALLMASHGGESMHLETLSRVMQKLQVVQDELLCGIHAPTHDSTKNALIANGQKPTVLHNNCSGKHCAMVAVSKQEGWALDSYIDMAHPLQREIKLLLRQLASIEDKQVGVGVDGCSAATFILPLQAIAKLYSMLAFPSTADENLNTALDFLFSSGAKNPEMIAGSKRLDTMIMRCSAGTLFAKTGAEGVYAIAVAPNAKYPSGLGIAMKIADGDPTHRARNCAILSLLHQLGIFDEDQLRNDEELAQIRSGIIRNLRKIEVGKIKSVFETQS